MAAERFLKTVRELVRCYQAFEAYSAQHIRGLDLTPSQFDIIATLGNTPGMSFRELGERTLITKGTLTGVVDRLAAKKLVRRVPSSTDGRSQIVQLTARGVALFDSVFPAHVEHFRRVFDRFGTAEQQEVEAILNRLSSLFEAAGKLH